MRGFLQFIGKWFRNATDAPIGGEPAPIPTATVKHIPADGVIPEGWVRLPGVFRFRGHLEDAMALPGQPICVDALRPGESIDLSIMIREPFHRARTPGAASENEGPVQ